MLLRFRFKEANFMFTLVIVAYEFARHDRREVLLPFDRRQHRERTTSSACFEDVKFVGSVLNTKCIR